MADFFAAVAGVKFNKSQYARMAKIYKDWPFGVESLMTQICSVAIKDVKGDPVDYLQKICNQKRGVKRNDVNEKGFSRDEFVES